MGLNPLDWSYMMMTRGKAKASNVQHEIPREDLHTGHQHDS